MAPLQEKLGLLIRRFNELKEENLVLKAAISRQDEELASLRAEEERLRQEFAREDLKRHLQQLTGHRKEQIKKQIEQILMMIEKNINFLN
ncbi:MAG TPA: hypothetical protein VFL76_11095 [Edaphocola sp.]|nr:hypothetical protein [Edaphocola sp.]